MHSEVVATMTKQWAAVGVPLSARDHLQCDSHAAGAMCSNDI